MSKTLSEILDKHINELKAGHNELLETDIKAWVAEAVNRNLIACQPDCTETQHAYHKGSWDTVRAIEERLQLDNLESEV